MPRNFDLKLDDGRTVTMSGNTPEHAADRWQDLHGDHVIATRRATGQGTISVLGEGGVIDG
jgi:hypothetical protein